MLGPEVKFVDKDYILYKGRKLLYLAGIDYHRLSSNSEILNAASEATKEYGLCATGSRTTTGNHCLYVELEKVAADFFGTEASVLLPSGYLSNLVILQAVGSEFDSLFIDEKAHSSLIDAAGQVGKPIHRYNNLDAQHLADQLKKYCSKKEKPLVLTDGVFPARGEIAPLKEYCDVLDGYGGKILVDDAHAMAVVGKTGKGTVEAQGVSHRMVYQSGTLSKGFGTGGGIVPASVDLANDIYKNSSAFTGCTGLALPIAAAAIKSIRYLKEHDDLISSLQERALALKTKFSAIGFDMPQTVCPIFSVTYHDVEKNQRLKEILLENGIYPPFINYPGAPEGGHFRFILTSTTTIAQEELLFNAIKSSL